MNEDEPRPWAPWEDADTQRSMDPDDVKLLGLYAHLLDDLGRRLAMVGIDLEPLLPIFGRVGQRITELAARPDAKVVARDRCRGCGQAIIQPAGRGRRREWCEDACRRRNSR